MSKLKPKLYVEIQTKFGMTEWVRLLEKKDDPDLLFPLEKWVVETDIGFYSSQIINPEAVKTVELDDGNKPFTLDLVATSYIMVCPLCGNIETVNKIEKDNMYMGCSACGTDFTIGGLKHIDK